MVLALSLVGQWSNVLIVLLSIVILVFLLRSIQITNKLWLSSFIAVILIGLITISHIVAYNSLTEQLKNQEAAIDTMKANYEILKSESVAAQGAYEESRNGVKTSREDLAIMKQRLNTEFDKAIRDIRTVYAGISDEELDRRANNAVRKARQTLQKNVFR